MQGVSNYLLHTGLVSSQPEPSVWQCLVCIPSSEYPVLQEYVIVMPSSDELMSPLEGVFGEMQTEIHRGSHMSAHILLNLLNEMGKRDNMRGLLSILSLVRNELDKFNKHEHEC